MPLIPVLKRLRQGTCHVFETSLDLQGKIILGINYTRPTWVIVRL